MRGEGRLGSILGAYAAKCRCSAADFEAFTFTPKPPAEVHQADVAVVEPKALTDLLASHAAEVEKIEGVFAEKRREWPDLYMADLEKLSDERRVAGDFAGYNAAVEELERYMSTREWRMSDGSNRALLELQERHVEKTQKYKKDHDDALAALNARTISTMQNLLSKFTRENDIAAARAVNNELIKLTGNP